jgi:hypothetical protein
MTIPWPIRTLEWGAGELRTTAPTDRAQADPS